MSISVKNIPTDWKLKKLKDVSKFSNGKGHEQVIDENGNYIVVNSKFISTDGLVKKFSNKNLSPLYKGEITMVMSDIPNGKAIAKCYIIDEDNKYTLNQRICSIKSKNNCDFKFLYYVINRNRYFLGFDNGVSQTNLRKDEVLDCPVQLPPLPEQQKIAEILSTVDAKIEVIDQQITETQALKKGLMQRLLTKGIGHTEFKNSALGEIPKSWEVVEIQQLIDQGRIISHLDGNHGGLYPNADEFINEGVPYIGANCFLNNRVDFSKCKHLSMERSLKFRKGVAKNGDVLFAHNATVGPVAFLETELDFVILSTTATYFRLDNKTIDAKYWLFFLSSPTFKNQYEKVMGQSTRNQVPITMQRSFYSVIPTFEEQKEISEILNTSDKKLEILLEKKTHYQELKQGLMQQLLTGKIRVKI
jgi:type I restriction enzyme S subunit